MDYKRKKLEAKGLDEKEWQSYFHRHQQEYIRLKLRSVKRYWEGASFGQVARELAISEMSVRNYVNQYLLGGLKALSKATTRKQPQLLNDEQQVAFKQVLLHTCPEDHQLAGRIWTGATMKQYLKKTYQVDYKGGIYDLLERLNLSHQKAHADYANADPAEQQAFLDVFTNILLASDNQTAVVSFDEFSVSEKPTTYYGWAEKNTRPKVKTNEKKLSGSMGC